MYNTSSMRLSADFSAETWEARKTCEYIYISCAKNKTKQEEQPPPVDRWW